LYSIILGLFLLVFGEPHYLTALLVLQYALIFASSLLIYRITRRLTESNMAAMIAGLAGIFNLTVIFFGFMILSETLALFLFTLMAWLILRNYNSGRPWLILVAGLTSGLLILTRYNMIGIPVVAVVLLAVAAAVERERISLSGVLRNILLFIIGVVFITSLWALRNYITFDRFELIPKHHTGQRWAVPATIDENNTVSGEYREVHEIFLRTRYELLEKERSRVYRKSSLLEHGLIRKINDSFRPEVSGYFMYRDAEDELLALYGLEKKTESIRILNEKLKPYYEEIAKQNRGKINRLRVYSFLYSFKHISPTLPMEEPVNLNVLPSFILKAFKILFILMVVLTYSGSVVHIIWMISRRGRLREALPWLIMYGLIWYFPLANTYANVLGDANRFRYPADILITGLFISLIFLVRQMIFTRNERTATVD
jgi:4-amino-4-deoxy-L-arabinose transferase-like glycosyltransferase